jgi:RNA polymerase sigma-70 factor, ECF subfamily
MQPTATSSLIEMPTRARTAELVDFDSVIQRHWPRVYRYVLASVRDHDVAQTLAQDCFFKAYQNRSRFRGEASVQTWLMQIAVNLVRDHTRSGRFQFWKRTPTVAVEDTPIKTDAINPEQTVLVKERVAAVWDAASLLPERQRTVFLLRFVDEMELLEIAAVTGLRESSVKVHLFRALRRVRETVGRLK